MFDWITTFVEKAGYLGIALLMFAENVFPPIPSELIMPLSGFQAARGDLNIFLVVASGVVGALAGALLWYYVGVWVGTERLKNWAGRHGRWLTMSRKDVDKADAWFDRYGGWAVLVGRLIPTVRTFISVPAGLAEMGLPKFLFYTTLGTTVWTAFLALAGYYLEGEYDKIAGWLNPVSTGVVVLIAAYYLYRVATFKKEPRAGEEGAAEEDRDVSRDARRSPETPGYEPDRAPRPALRAATRPWR